ncbi:MAG: class I SAM-dependent methyltransferase [Methanomicrobiales archaeon]
MKGLKVQKTMANEIRKILLKKSLINLNYKIKQTDKGIIIPLIKNPDPHLLNELDLSPENIVESEFQNQKRGPKSLKDYLTNKIDPKTMEEIKSSFDIIGDVVILEIPQDLDDYKYIIGDAALKFTKRRTVYRKKSKIKGLKRTREFEHLAGEKNSETVHKEFGARFSMDVKKVYFSPRLATERKRISNLVEDGETIVDMFAGVGPFSIIIARENNVKIYAIDINPDAYYYLKQNIEMNKVQERIVPVLGDAADYLKLTNIKANRILMNLPGIAWKYLENGMEALKYGGILHYYEFASDFETAVNRIENAAQPRNVEILNKRKVKSKSPGKWHIGVDAKVF